MKLKVLSRYRNGPLGVEYEPGKEITVDQTRGEFLLRDAPGAFMEISEAPPVQTTAFDEPPRTTAVKRTPRTKGTTAADSDA